MLRALRRCCWQTDAGWAASTAQEAHFPQSLRLPGLRLSVFEWCLSTTIMIHLEDVQADQPDSSEAARSRVCTRLACEARTRECFVQVRFVVRITNHERQSINHTIHSIRVGKARHAWEIAIVIRTLCTVLIQVVVSPRAISDNLWSLLKNRVISDF